MVPCCTNTFMTVREDLRDESCRTDSVTSYDEPVENVYGGSCSTSGRLEAEVSATGAPPLRALLQKNCRSLEIAPLPLAHKAIAALASNSNVSLLRIVRDSTPSTVTVGGTPPTVLEGSTRTVICASPHSPSGVHSVRCSPTCWSPNRCAAGTSTCCWTRRRDWATLDDKKLCKSAAAAVFAAAAATTAVSAPSTACTSGSTTKVALAQALLPDP